MAVVVDASVAIGWLVLNQATPLTRAALDFVERKSGWVPPHFAIEMSRALRRQERRALMSAAAIDQAVALLQRQSLIQDQMDAIDSVDSIIALARRYTLRVADAAYLELSMRMKLPLATKDQALARAAAKTGIPLFEQ